jgi:hypothetical protein
MDWTDLALDGDKCGILVDTVMNFRFPGIFFGSS